MDDAANDVWPFKWELLSITFMLNCLSCFLELIYNSSSYNKESQNREGGLDTRS